MKYIVQHFLRYKLGNASFEHSPASDKSFASLEEASNYIRNDNRYVGSDMLCRHKIVYDIESRSLNYSKNQ